MTSIWPQLQRRQFHTNVSGLTDSHSSSCRLFIEATTLKSNSIYDHYLTDRVICTTRQDGLVLLTFFPYNCYSPIRELYISDGFTFSVRYFTAADKKLSTEYINGRFYFLTIFRGELFRISQRHMCYAYAFGISHQLLGFRL